MTLTKKLGIILSDLCIELELSYLLVSKIVSNTPLTVQTLLYLDHNKVYKNFKYPVENAACKNVFKESFYLIAKSVHLEFPNDPDLKKLEIESYAGIVLKKNSNIVGHLAIFDRKPISDEIRIETALRTSAIRIENII